MAKVTFNPNQPVQSLSGSVGALTFRNFNGSITYQSRMNHVSITGVKP